MNNNSTIAILGAMDCEVSELKSKLQSVEEKVFGNFVVTVGSFCNHNIILAKTGVGKVNAAVYTQFIIDKFSPEAIINTGLAGGIAPNLKIGDVVIGEKLVQYDFDVSALGYPKGYMCTGIDKDKPTVFYSDKNLISKFMDIINQESSAHKGIIASGDTFVSCDNHKKEIRELFNATAVEMEGCAIAQTAALNNIPFLVIRTISDLADSNASEKFVLNEIEIAERSCLTMERLLANV